MSTGLTERLTKRLKAEASKQTTGTCSATEGQCARTQTTLLNQSFRFHNSSCWVRVCVCVCWPGFCVCWGMAGITWHTHTCSRAATLALRCSVEQLAGTRPYLPLSVPLISISSLLQVPTSRRAQEANKQEEGCCGVACQMPDESDSFGIPL